MLHLRMFVYFSTLAILLNISYVTSMTREQCKNAALMLKKACMPKTQVTEEQVGEMDQGKFIEDKNVMCYAACIYKMGQIASRKTIYIDRMIKQVDLVYPEDMKAPAKKAIENCRGVAKNYNDICEASFYTAKCIYESDPDVFIWP